MKKYQFEMRVGPPSEQMKKVFDFYDSTDVDAELASWLNARDVWMASDKAKDARIKELERELALRGSDLDSKS